MPARRILTLHAPLGRALSDPVLKAVGRQLSARGWHVWLSMKELPDVVVMCNVPEGDELEDGT